MSEKKKRLPYENAILNVKEIVRTEFETNSDFGIIPEKRSVDDLIKFGVVNVNKPKGPTSHQVADFTKQILGISKAGQSGTLDPGVTGVLPIGLSRATKVLQTLLKSGKEYVCFMHIHSKQTDEKIKEICNKFIGDVRQMPPIKSAVKRQWRTRKVYYLEILEIKDNKQDVLFRIGCQAGTYIRKICSDMGDAFGCGAHMAQLLRTKVGKFTDDNMYTLQEITDAYHDYKENGFEDKIREIIFPMEAAVEHIPKVWIMDTTIRPICHGGNLFVPGISKVNTAIEKDQMVAVMSLKGELVALGLAKLTSKQMVNEDSGIAVCVDKVFMDPSIYPKFEK